MIFRYTADSIDAGTSAGTGLKRHCGLSPTLVKAIRLHGNLEINGHFARMKTLLQEGDIVVAKSPQADSPALHLPADLPLLYQSPWLLALSKPAGMVVHPSLNKNLPDLCSLLSDQALHPVNRLDRDTTGIVLLALNGHAHWLLTQSSMKKRYLAIVHGRFAEKEGCIQVAIRRASDSIILREAGEGGKRAETLWQELDYFPSSDLSLVSFVLKSGRTHQIRVHARYAGCPLLGDSLYGLSSLNAAIEKSQAPEASSRLLSSGHIKLDRLIDRQALHAETLNFTDPQSKKRIHLKDPLPEDILAVLRHCGLPEKSLSGQIRL